MGCPLLIGRTRVQPPHLFFIATKLHTSGMRAPRLWSLTAHYYEMLFYHSYSDRRGHFIICTVYIHNVIRNINFRLRFLLHNGIFPHGHLLFSFSLFNTLTSSNWLTASYSDHSHRLSVFQSCVSVRHIFNHYHNAAKVAELPS